MVSVLAFKNCTPMTVTLVSTYTFLSIDVTAKTLTFAPSEEEKEGTYNDAYIRFTYNNMNVDAPIHLTIGSSSSSSSGPLCT